VIRKHSREWQAHLQQIGDFLLEGEGRWWSKDDECIELHDISDQPAPECGPNLHHFRSSTLMTEAEYLKESWKKCINKKKVIPTHILRLDQANGNTEVIHTPYLNQQHNYNTLQPNSNQPSTDDDNSNNQCEHDQAMEDDKDFEQEDTAAEETIQVTHQPTAECIADDSSINPDDDDEVIDIALAGDEVITLHETSICADEHIQQIDSVVSNPIPENNTDPKHNELQSHLGKAVEVVLGKTREVMNFEKYLV